MLKDDGKVVQFVEEARYLAIDEIKKETAYYREASHIISVISQNLAECEAEPVKFEC